LPSSPPIIANPPSFPSAGHLCPPHHLIRRPSAPPHHLTPPPSNPSPPGTAPASSILPPPPAALPSNTAIPHQ
jgi:hypothetical protein